MLIIEIIRQKKTTSLRGGLNFIKEIK